MQQAVVLGIILLMIVLLLTQKATLGWIGLLIPCVLILTGISSPAEALQGLTSDSMFVFTGAFVLSEAFFQAGLSDLLGEWMQKKLRKIHHESLILLIICLISAGLSSVLSSMGVQVAMMSLILALGANLKVSKTKSMMAIGYAATIGGTMTLMGTPLNMVGRAAYENAVPGDTIGLFEISAITVPAGLLMILYFCFIGSRFLPDRRESEICGLQQRQVPKQAKFKQVLTAILFCAFILLIALDGQKGIPDTVVTSLAVILILGAFHVLTTEQIIHSIRWDILMFIMGIQSLGTAFSSTDIDRTLSQYASRLFQNGIPEHMLIAAVFLIVAFITQFLNNSGTFGVVLPLVLVLASSLNINLKPVMIAAMIASSCSFALPIATPTFPMLAEEGDIRFQDWFIQGMPLILIGFLACVLFVPFFWPVY